MTAPRLRSLTVKGFRAYGATEQTLNLPSDLAVVWGPNSKGKTSFADAIEFLLTGRTARRELMASSRDEFADALRNAYLPTGQQVYVAAKLIVADGSSHEIKRILTTDYAKKQDCESRLEIDGKTATEQQLAALGITLSQPPLAAPVLAQHTLSYIFSVRPQDRATYFKVLLEVTDLDHLRNDIASLSSELAPPQDSLLSKFDTALTIPSLKALLGADALQSAIRDTASVATTLDAGAKALITAAGAQMPPTLLEGLAAVERILNERRSKTFSVASFKIASLPAWSEPAVWTALDRYVEERAKIDEETRRLVALFDEALKLPAVASVTTAVDCPLCETQGSLTLARVQVICTHVANAAGFTGAEAIARSALSQLVSSATGIETAARTVLPVFAKQPASQRRASGFTVARLKALLGEQAEDLIRPWLSALKALRRASRLASQAATSTNSIIDAQAASLSDLDPSALQATFAKLYSTREALRIALELYTASAEALVVPVLCQNSALLK